MTDSGDEYKPQSKPAKRRYVKREPKATATAISCPPPSPNSQITNIAFNIHGWGLEDGMTGRKTYEVINANKATMAKGGFESKIRELEANGVQNIYRQNHHYSAREKDTSLAKYDNNVVQYLVVGYTLQEDDPLFVNDKTLSRYSEGEIVGEDRPPHQHLFPWSACLPPVLVVTPVKENTGTSVRLFALILPRNGLCQPVLITHERIFYRWEFRASSGIKPALRNRVWNEVVILIAFEKMLGNPVSTKEPTAKRRKLNTVPFIKGEPNNKVEFISSPQPNSSTMCELVVGLDDLFQPVIKRSRSFQNLIGSVFTTTKLRIVLTPEICSIVEAVKSTKSDRILIDFQNALNDTVRVNDDPLLYPGLLAFVSQEPFGLMEAEATVVDIQKLWTNLGPYARADVIHYVKTVMRGDGIVVGLHNLRDFFDGVLPAMKSKTWKDKELAHFIRLIIPQSDSQRSNLDLQLTIPRIPPDTVMLVELMTAMIQIRNSQQQFAKILLASNNNIKLANSQEMTYNLNIDYAGAQRSFRRNIEQLIISAKDQNSCIDDILVWFKKLRALFQES